MPRIFRQFWPDPFQGRVWLNVNLAGVVVKPNRGPVSAVHVSACEYHKAGGIFGNAGNLSRGDAFISVWNVHPYVRNAAAADAIGQNGGVEFALQVDFHLPLLIATTITVFDEPVEVNVGSEA